MSRGILVSVKLVVTCVNNRVGVDKGVVLVPTADKLMTWSCTASRGILALPSIPERISPRLWSDSQTEGMYRQCAYIVTINGSVKM